jgi:hypothetical protein
MMLFAASCCGQLFMNNVDYDQLIKLSTTAYKIYREIVGNIKDMDTLKGLIARYGPASSASGVDIKDHDMQPSATFANEPSVSITYDDLDNIRTLLNILTPRIEIGSTYDIVLYLTSLQNISYGWEIHLQNINYTEFSSKYNSLTRGIVVSSIGFYDTGKTYVINRLLNESFPAGVHLETRGLSMVERDGVFHIDTEGSRRAVEPELMTDRLATDHFVQQLALIMGQIVLFHVDALHAQDVFTIKRLQQTAQQLNPKLQRFVVVHNMWRYTTEEEVTKHIQTDIVKAFGAQELLNKRTGCRTWNSNFGSALHIVIAREGSPAGILLNKCAFDILRTIIDSASTSPFSFNIMDDIRLRVSGMLPLFFYHPFSRVGTVPYLVNPVGRKVRLAQLPKHQSSPSLVDGYQDQVIGNSVYQVAVKAMNWILGSQGASVESIGNNDGDMDVGDDDGRSCRQFEDLNPDVFNVTLEERMVRSDSSPKYYLTLFWKNATLQYFPVDSEHAIPSAAFNPKYDVFMKENRWVIMMDLLDSHYYINYLADRVEIFGCRSLSVEYQHGGYERQNSLDTRRFSTFHIDIKAPIGVNCATTQKTVRHARINNGVLVLSFEKECEYGELCSRPARPMSPDHAADGLPSVDVT